MKQKKPNFAEYILFTLDDGFYVLLKVDRGVQDVSTIFLVFSLLFLRLITLF